MTTPPRISVYVPSHNYGRFLADAIESVLRQTVDDWEMIVVDDGSTDGTHEVMNLYRGHPKISLHRTEGIGLPAVCNYALARARGKYVIRLDGDDVFDENILLVLVSMMERDPGLALVFPDYYLVDPFGEIFAQERRERLYSANHMLDLPPNGACTLVRADVLKEVGGYREDLGAQDGFDLWTKVTKKYKSANVNLPLFYYRRHGTNLTTNTQRILNARQRIKMDAVQDTLAALRPIIGVIPCRRNFDFTPDVWKQEIAGKSLLERAVKVCLSTDLFDRVVVTCDNPGSRTNGKDVQRSTTALHAARFQYHDQIRQHRADSEMICHELDPNLTGMTIQRFIQSPFITIETLGEAASTLAMNDADPSHGVEEIVQTVFRRTRNGLEPLNRTGNFRSDFDLLYRDVRSCMATRNSVLATGSLSGQSVVSFVVNEEECFFIDSARRMRIAQQMREDQQ